MRFNLQISTFIVGVLCSLRNRGNSAFSPISFMLTQGCMFCICFLLGSKSQLQRLFLLHCCVTLNLPVLDISNQGAWCELGCCSREPFFENSGHISLDGLFSYLGSQITSQNWEGSEPTLPTAEGTVEADLAELHRKWGMSPNISKPPLHSPQLSWSGALDISPSCPRHCQPLGQIPPLQTVFGGLGLVLQAYFRVKQN